jgi:hypothetical protein
MRTSAPGPEPRAALPDVRETIGGRDSSGIAAGDQFIDNHKKRADAYSISPRKLCTGDQQTPIPPEAAEAAHAGAGPPPLMSRSDGPPAMAGWRRCHQEIR